MTSKLNINVLITFKFTEDEDLINRNIQELQQTVSYFKFDNEYGWVSCSPFRIDLQTIDSNQSNFNLENVSMVSKDRTGFILIRGKLPMKYWSTVKNLDFVMGIYRDTKIQLTKASHSYRDTSKITISTIRRELGIDKIWNSGFKGEGISIGIVDYGIEKNNNSTNYPNFNNLYGGYPESNFGTISESNGHGNMVGHDVLAIAPKVKLYDIRISELSLGDMALAYEWALKEFKATNHPKILTNSWALYNKYTDLSYAYDMEHPFTQFVEKVMSEGMIVLFAAGNCGVEDSVGKCGNCHGYNNSIWGANSHPNVITVGAVSLKKSKSNNLKINTLNYSSKGAGSLSKWKPDLCCFSEFTLKNFTHTGTSVSTPLVAGICALLLQKNPTLTQNEIHKILTENCDLLNSNWNFQSGAGIINAWRAFSAI